MRRKLVIVLSLALLGTVIITALMTLAGLIGSGAVYEYEYRRDFHQWHRLELPSGAIHRIVDADSSFVRVQTRSQEIYECKVSGSSLSSAIPCVAETQSSATQTSHPAKIVSGFCGVEDPIEPPSPPGEIADSLVILECAADAAWQINYVVLTDGSAWAWDHSGGLGSLAALAYNALGGLIGFLVGLSLSAVFIRFMWSRRYGLPQRPEVSLDTTSRRSGKGAEEE